MPHVYELPPPVPVLNQCIEQIAALFHENRMAVVGVILLFFMLCCFLLQVAAIWSLLSHRGLLRRILHPSNFPKGSIWQERAEALVMWLDRTAPPEIEPPNAVRSPTRTYQLLNPVGTGDLCDAHRAESEGQLYVLKVSRFPGCDSLLAKEQFVLGQLHERSLGDIYDRYLPMPVERFRWKSRSYFAYVWRTGLLPAAEILKQYPSGLDGRHVSWMFNRVLEVLGFAHRHGWIHGAVLPPHLLFDPREHGLHLLGWMHAEPCDQPLRFVSRRYQTWYPPECHRRDPATVATDIYLAVRSMIWLAGGDPLSAVMPKHIPMEIRRFFQRCLEDSPSRRPQDAWLLHEEFNALLGAVYGPPQFCPLTLT
jgi:serine/threonine protein kinase